MIHVWSAVPIFFKSKPKSTCLLGELITNSGHVLNDMTQFCHSCREF